MRVLELIMMDVPYLRFAAIMGGMLAVVLGMLGGSGRNTHSITTPEVQNE